jgi:hypothetical protein
MSQSGSWISPCSRSQPWTNGPAHALPFPMAMAASPAGAALHGWGDAATCSRVRRAGESDLGLRNARDSDPEPTRGRWRSCCPVRQSSQFSKYLGRPPRYLCTSRVHCDLYAIDSVVEIVKLVPSQLDYKVLIRLIVSLPRRYLAASGRKQTQAPRFHPMHN